MSEKFVSSIIEDRVATITLARPETLNALSAPMKAELSDALTVVESDDNIWGLIITGQGRAFSSGADIAELPDDCKHAERMAAHAQQLFNRIENLSKPVVVAINGLARGGGFELALACDIRIAAESASFGFPEVAIGAIPCYGGIQRLIRLVGMAKTKELVFTGRSLPAHEAESLGLVSKVVPDRDLLEKAHGIMALVLRNAPKAVAFAKTCINQGSSLPFEEGLLLERKLIGELAKTRDLQEGRSAFFEKRTPDFLNR